MENLLDRIRELFYLISDFLSYIFTILLEDRRRLLRILGLVLGVAVLILAVVGVTRLRKAAPAPEPDPESTQVMEITIAPSPTPTEVPRRVDEGVTSTTGTLTMINEYLAKKNAQAPAQIQDPQTGLGEDEE